MRHIDTCRAVRHIDTQPTLSGWHASQLVSSQKSAQLLGMGGFGKASGGLVQLHHVLEPSTAEQRLRYILMGVVGLHQHKAWSGCWPTLRKTLCKSLTNKKARRREPQRHHHRVMATQYTAQSEVQTSCFLIPGPDLELFTSWTLSKLKPAHVLSREQALAAATHV